MEVSIFLFLQNLEYFPYILSRRPHIKLPLFKYIALLHPNANVTPLTKLGFVSLILEVHSVRTITLVDREIHEYTVL